MSDFDDAAAILTEYTVGGIDARERAQYRQVQFDNLPLHMVGSHLRVVADAYGIRGADSDDTLLTELDKPAVVFESTGIEVIESRPTYRFDLRCAGTVTEVTDAQGKLRVEVTIDRIGARLLSLVEFILLHCLLSGHGGLLVSNLDNDTFERLDDLLASPDRRPCHKGHVLWVQASFE